MKRRKIDGRDHLGQKETQRLLEAIHPSWPCKVTVPYPSEPYPSPRQVQRDLPDLRFVRVPSPWEKTSIWLFKTAEDENKFKTYVGAAP